MRLMPSGRLSVCPVIRTPLRRVCCCGPGRLQILINCFTSFITASLQLKSRRFASCVTRNSGPCPLDKYPSRALSSPSAPSLHLPPAPSPSPYLPFPIAPFPSFSPFPFPLSISNPFLSHPTLPLKTAIGSGGAL